MFSAAPASCVAGPLRVRYADQVSLPTRRDIERLPKVRFVALLCQHGHTLRDQEPVGFKNLAWHCRVPIWHNKVEEDLQNFRNEAVMAFKFSGKATLSLFQSHSQCDIAGFSESQNPSSNTYIMYLYILPGRISCEFWELYYLSMCSWRHSLFVVSFPLSFWGGIWLWFSSQPILSDAVTLKWLHRHRERGS